MTGSRRRYEVDTLVQGRRLLTALEERFPGGRERPRAFDRRYYDTFDWRLHRAGGTLEAAEEEGETWLRWRDLAGATRRRLRVQSVPEFAGDLPPGPTRESLTKVLSVRRLLPVAAVDGRVEIHRVLDRSRKTLVRLELTGARASGPDPAGRRKRMPAVLEVVALRGYETVYRKVVSHIEREVGLAPAAQSELDLALAVLGRRARDYTSKLEFRLPPGQPAEAALREILFGLLQVIEANEDGVRRDLDSEFLHDFRVAVRRTRSALGQLPGVLPREAVAGFRRELSWLGGVTGPTRDLDVYRLKLPVYAAELPAETRRNLEPLERYLSRQQRIEQRRLARALGTRRYRLLITAWGDFLSSPVEPGDDAPRAATPILDLASRRIWKRYRRVIKDGLAVGPHTPAAKVHRLRIDCKKLRYLLEFFRGLYDAGEIGPLIKELKRLQDNLGDFNDYQVQQEALADYGRRMAAEGLAPPETLLAMGRLLDRLAVAQAAERRRITERFARFASRPNDRRFRRLFKSAARGPA